MSQADGAATRRTMRAEFCEDVAFLLATESPAHVLTRLGGTAHAVAMRLRRGGRADLAVVFERLDRTVRPPRGARARARAARQAQSLQDVR